MSEREEKRNISPHTWSVNNWKECMFAWHLKLPSQTQIHTGGGVLLISSSELLPALLATFSNNKYFRVLYFKPTLPGEQIVSGITKVNTAIVPRLKKEDSLKYYIILFPCRIWTTNVCIRKLNTTLIVNTKYQRIL